MFELDDIVRIKPEAVDQYIAVWRNRFKRAVMIGTVIAVRDNGRVRVQWKGSRPQKFPHEWRLEMDVRDIERIERL